MMKNISMDVEVVYSRSKNTPAISVIIPVFNAGSAYTQLFFDLSKQTLRDFELILVDDGSQDATLQEILHYAKEKCEGFAGVKVLTEKNSGQGTARNTGIDYADGSYLVFLDQDDRIRTDYLDVLYQTALHEDADVVISGYREIFDNGKIRNEVVLTNNKWCRFMNITPWGKIYRTSFIKKHNIRFLPVKLGEDIYFNIKAYSNMPNVAYTTYVGYHWMVNMSSLSRTEHRELHEDTTLFPILNAIKDLRIDYKSVWDEDPDLDYFVVKTCIYHILLLSKTTSYENTYAYRAQLFSYLKEKFPASINSPLFAPGKPTGEKPFVRRTVSTYMILYRCHLDGLLLRFLCEKRLK